MNADENARLISDQFLASLCQRIGSEWPLLGISLMFSQAQLDQLQEAYPRNMPKCVMSMLTQWKNVVAKFDDINPWKILQDALKEVGRYDLANDLEVEVSSLRDLGLNEIRINGMEEQVGSISFGLCDNNIDRISAVTKYGILQCIISLESPSEDDFNEILQGQTKQCLERWSKERSMFVETKAWKAAWQLISDKRIVIICGNPGDGKTTLAYFLLSKLEKEGFTPASVTSPELIEQLYDVKDKVVFFVDDAFGSPGLNTQLVENWIRLSSKVASFLLTDNFRLVMTSRRQLFSSCQLEIEDCDCFRGSILDLTETEITLIDMEKKEILSRYCRNKQINVTEEKMDKACSSLAAGFPLLCKLYTASYDLQKIEDFFEKPLSVLVHQLQILAKHDQKTYCGLIMLLINDGKLSNSVFDVFQQNDQTKAQIAVVKEACQLESSVPLSSIEDGLRSLVGVYVSEIEDYYVFMHDAIFDAVTFVFGEKYPSKLLKMCSAKFLHRRVRCYKCVQKQDGITDILYLPKRLAKDLATRFMSDVNKGYLLEVFQHPSFLNQEVYRHFTHEFNKLSDASIQHLIRKRDNRTGKKFMEFVCKSEIIDIARRLFDRGVAITDDMWLYAIKHNQIAVVDLLMEKGMDVNKLSDVYGISGLHVAAEEGHLEMLKHLINKGGNASLQTTDGAEPLNFAFRTWKVDCMRFLLELGVNPNITQTYGQSPIHIAASKGNLEWTKYLVSKGADVLVKNGQDQQPIHFASASDNPDLITYLLEMGAEINAVTKDGKTTLHFACGVGQACNVELLLKCGVDLECRDNRDRLPIHVASMSRVDCSDIIDLLVETAVNKKVSTEESNSSRLLESNFGNTKTCEDVTAHDTFDVVDGSCTLGNSGNHVTITENGAFHSSKPVNKEDSTLFQYYVDVRDQNDMTPLHFACKQMNDSGIERVKYLVDKGADIHAIDITKMQPLLYACDSRSVRTVDLLIEHGADINWRGFNRQCAIHFTAASDNTDLLEILIRNGADINSSSSSGMKPIHFACRQNAAAYLSMLLKLGVDPNEEDDAKYTPLFYACLHGHVEIAKMLLACGADVDHVDLLGRRPVDMLQFRECDSEIKQLFAKHAEQGV